MTAGGPYGSSPHPDSIFKQRTHQNLPRREAPEAMRLVSRPRNQRAQETPGAHGTRDPCAKDAHGGPQVPGTPGVPCAMALRLMARSPRRRIRFCHRRLRIKALLDPVEPTKTSAGLTSATDARTTRFCRTQRPSSTQVRAAVCDLPTCGEGVEAPFVCAPAIRSRETRPATPCAPDAAASTASPAQRP
jgi:hypothetical protein